MKRIVLVMILCSSIASSMTAEIQKYLEEFDTYLEKHEKQMRFGSTLFWSGISISVLGGLTASTGLSLKDSNYINDDTWFIAGGYSLLGAGVLSVVIGVPLFLVGIRNYRKTLEQRNRYFILLENK